MCAHARMHACVCACVHLCVCTCMHARLCAWTHMCMCTCVHVYTHTNICMHMCVCTCVHARLCVCMHVCVHTRVVEDLPSQAAHTQHVPSIPAPQTPSSRTAAPACRPPGVCGPRSPAALHLGYVLRVSAPGGGAPNRGVRPTLGSAVRLSCEFGHHSVFLTLGLLPCDVQVTGIVLAPWRPRLEGRNHKYENVL